MDTRRRSPLGLLLLLNLQQGPSHAYRLHKLLDQTGKARIVNLKTRASVYQTLERLAGDGLVEPIGTSSNSGYPDRTEYAITDRGREAAIEWIRDLLRSAGLSSTAFIVALSAMFVLAPDDARSQLNARRARLTTELAEAEQATSGPGVPEGLPRLFLLDEEYRRAVLMTELTWTEQLIADLTDGSLTWSREFLDEIAARFNEHD
jgi:DNA-binding PadR family transcriptional regulator